MNNPVMSAGSHGNSSAQASLKTLQIKVVLMLIQTKTNEKLGADAHACKPRAEIEFREVRQAGSSSSHFHFSLLLSVMLHAVPHS
jgi:hypothetical protein